MKHSFSSIRAVSFVAILVVGWVAARLLRTVVDKVLTRVGFDRWVDDAVG